MTRRITLMIQLGLETDTTTPLDEIAQAAVEEIEQFVPTVWAGGTRSAVVTRVHLQRASEQSDQSEGVRWR